MITKCFVLPVGVVKEAARFLFGQEIDMVQFATQGIVRLTSDTIITDFSAEHTIRLMSSIM